jgi:hypothetical protein
MPVEDDEMLGGFPFNWNITWTTEWIGKNTDKVNQSVVKVGPPGPWADSPNLEEACNRC